MTTFLHDIPDDGFGNFCPVCGEPRNVCQCTSEDYDNYFDDLADCEPRERVECKYCGGDGMLDDISPCPHCDGEGFEWWLD